MDGALRGGVAADGHGGEAGAFALALAGEALHAAGFGGDEALVGGVVGVGSARAEAGDCAVDQAGVVGGERRVIRAERLAVGGAQSGDEHIGVAGEFAQPRAAGVGFEVELDAALAAQPHRSGGERAQRVAAGAFEFDDVRAKVGQHHRGDAADRAAGQVEHADFVEHSGHRQALNHSGTQRPVYGG